MSACTPPIDDANETGSTQASWPVLPGTFCGEDAQLMTAIFPLGLLLLVYPPPYPPDPIPHPYPPPTPFVGRTPS